MAFLVAPPHPAKVVLEEVVALEGTKRPGQLALSPHHLGDRDGGVVIGDPNRHATEELEAGQVGGLEGLGALARIGGEEVGVRVGQRDDPERGLDAVAGDLDDGLAEVELGMTGWMAERDERFLRVRLGSLHRRLDLGVTAGVAVFVPQALEDLPRRVPLLGRGLAVIVEDLVDRGQVGTEHGLRAHPGHLIAGRLRVRQDLGQGLVPDSVVPMDGTLRRAFHQDLPSDLGPFVHVGVHPSPVLLVRSGTKP